MQEGHNWRNITPTRNDYSRENNVVLSEYYKAQYGKDFKHSPYQKRGQIMWDHHNYFVYSDISNKFRYSINKGMEFIKVRKNVEDKKHICVTRKSTQSL